MPNYSRQQDTATQLSGGTAWGPEDHPMPCTPHFSQLAFVGLCHGGHWSWIQINASSAVMSFDLLLHLQRPFIIKLGETRTFLRQVLLCYEAALQNSAVGLQFVAMQVSWPWTSGLGFQGGQRALPLWVTTVTCILTPAVICVTILVSSNQSHVRVAMEA